MALDLLISGATVVDGTGRASFTADIGVSGGEIVEVGRVSTPAARHLDADGLLVTPGFIDPHTHYDGQAMWDGELQPSSEHGVTTAVMGNCGVGFAPLRPGEQQRLVDLMTGVEDIPGTALHEGLDWGWESVSDYMDRLSAVPRAIDIAAQVVHDPIRLYVMGERAVRGEPATADDVTAMREHVRAGLAAGAIGFSTGRIDTHRVADGRNTPSYRAEAAELNALAGALRDFDGRVLQYVSDFDQNAGPAGFDAAWGLMEEMTRVGGRPTSLSLNQRTGAGDQWRAVVARAEAANKAGMTVRFQAMPRAIGVMLGLTATIQPFMAHPSFAAIADEPLERQVAALRDPVFRDRLKTEQPRKLAGNGTPYPPTLDGLTGDLPKAARRMFPMRPGFSYEPDLSTSVGARATARGQDVIDAILDALVEDEGRALIYLPFYNFAGGNLDVSYEMTTHPLTLMGLGDAGAHVGTVCDGAYTTFALPFWSRERDAGPRIPLEFLVHKMTGLQAEHFGFSDRGRIAPGLRADLNIIDMDRLRVELPYVAADLPAGGKRILQKATGYVATLVGGVPIVEQDALTGARPGRLLRAAH